MRGFTFIFLILGLIALTLMDTLAQVKKDSVEKTSATKKAIRQGMRLISTTPKDTLVNEKSTEPYAEYKGKIIRHIYIDRIGFEKSIYDSARKVEKSVVKVANALHVDTRPKIIRKHLFIKENRPLNPYQIADNERFLRDKDFILDSRINVIPIENSDSVDLSIVTRDVFSFGASLGGNIPSAPRISIFDANVNGRGQRIELITLIDPERNPELGYSLLYRKSSLFGSLTNLEMAYTELNKGVSYGDEKEYAMIFRLDRPLVSPYSRLAGGVELSRNWSRNVYNIPDSLFLSYEYNITDTWIGYNIGIHRQMMDRRRLFIAARVFDGVYVDQPEQELYKVVRRYNDVYGFLSEFTLYKQNYYKARYVYGFGRTEDLPYGINASLTSGYMKQLFVERPYAGLKLEYGKMNTKGNYYRLLMQVGGYEHKDKLEDVVLQSGISYLPKLWQFNRYKIRNYVSATYTQINNHRVIDYLNISKKEIPGFSSDSLFSDRRIALHAESAIFLQRSILGFRFAPFGSVDAVGLRCVNCNKTNNIFWGFSTGFRTRNENLIFGTIEVKMTYIPAEEKGQPKFVFGFKQNLRIKTTGSFVRKPSLIVYNN